MELSGDRGTRGVPGPEAVPSVLRRIEARTDRELFHHSRHVDPGQPARLNLPVAAD